MRFDIDAYRATFQGGARQYLFYVKPAFPPGIAGVNVEQATYLVRASSLPETTTEEIMLNWQGFDYKVPGKYTYPDWTITFNIDIESNINTMYMNWMNKIHDPTTNIYSAPNDLQADQQVEMIGIDGKTILKYKLIGAWVKMVGPVTLDYSSNDVAQFDVTYAYMYHVTNKAVYGVQQQFSG
jgi:hypothetical protein